MKNRNFYQIFSKALLLLWIVLLSISCEEKKVDKQPDNTLGQAMFYTSTDDYTVCQLCFLASF